MDVTTGGTTRLEGCHLPVTLGLWRTASGSGRLHHLYRYTASDGRSFHIADDAEEFGVVSRDEKVVFPDLEAAKLFLADYERG